MKKLLVTTALTFSLLAAGETYAADKEKSGTDEHAPYHHHEKGMCNSKILSKENVELCRTSMKQVYEKNKELHAQLKGLYSELNAIIKAPGFEEKAYINKSKEIANLQNTMHANETEASAKFLSRLTPEERVKLVDNFKNRKHGWSKFHKKPENNGKAEPDTSKK